VPTYITNAEFSADFSHELAPQPSTWRGSSEQILLNEVGWKARKHPAVAEVFSPRLLL
jgi:hypothetical protein